MRFGIRSAEIVSSLYLLSNLNQNHITLKPLRQVRFFFSQPADYEQKKGDRSRLHECLFGSDRYANVGATTSSLVPWVQS